MKKILIFTTIFVCLFSVFNLVGCGNKDNTSPVLTEIQATFKDFTKIDDMTYSLKVSNNTEIFNFSNFVSVAKDCIWKLTADIYGIINLPSKVGTLDVGDNTYYVLVTDKEENVRMYILKVRRKLIYTVYFETNGGSLLSSKQVEEDDSVVDIDTPIKENYDFVGWYTNSILTDQYNNNPITNNTTLYAKYSPKSFQINYYLDGGVNNIDNITSYNYESETFVLKAPIKNGYDFEGWYSDSSLIQSITSIPKYSSGVKNIYAKWIQIYVVENNTITYLTDHGQSLSELIIPESIDNIKINSLDFYLREEWGENGIDGYKKFNHTTSIILSENIIHISSILQYRFPNLEYNQYDGCDYLGTQTNDYYALIDNNIYLGSQKTNFTINNNAILLASNSIGINNNTDNTLTIPASVKYISKEAIEGGWSEVGSWGLFLTYDHIVFEDTTNWYASETVDGQTYNLSSIVANSELSAQNLQYHPSETRQYYWCYWKKI